MAETKRTVLLVDDDPDNRAFMQRAFRGDYRLLEAGDGEQALEVLRNNEVHVIITDQRMPRMSGTQLLERSLQINPRIVKIILSAYTDTTEILSAINVCRINHYLVKPVTVTRLREVVASALALVPESERFGA